MEEIKQFKYKSENEDIIKVANVKEELIRPDISYNLLFNPHGNFKKNNDYKVSMTQLDLNFYEKEELIFFSQTYGIKVIEKVFFDGSKRLVSCNQHVNSLYGNTSATLFYIEKEGKVILLFEFLRWQTKFQPRGPGEDYLGMDTSYVHSIWKDPVFLNDAMLQKIKSRIR